MRLRNKNPGHTKFIVIILIINLVCPGILLSTTALADTTTGLVGWWKFEEGSGTSAIDSSGSGNTGTLTNSPTRIQGARGMGLNFNGTTQFVDVGTPAVLDITSSITACAWVKFTGGASQQQIVTKGWDGSNTQYQLYTNGTNVYFNTFVGPGTTHGVTSSTTITSNVWEHWCGSFNGSAWIIYKNGKLDNSNPNVTAPIHTTKKVEIGSVDANGAPAQFWTGGIDDVRIYSRALTLQDVYMLYTNSANLRNGVLRNLNAKNN